MSEPARTPSPHESLLRTSAPSGPLRDWLAAMRATAPEARQEARQDIHQEIRQLEPAAAEPPIAEKVANWAPRLVSTAPKEQDDEVAEIVAENMMLKAKLRLEADRRDELQLLLAHEIRELRAHINEEIARMDDLRAERDLWKARCEALMQPLFQGR